MALAAISIHGSLALTKNQTVNSKSITLNDSPDRLLQCSFTILKPDILKLFSALHLICMASIFNVIITHSDYYSSHFEEKKNT